MGERKVNAISQVLGWLGVVALVVAICTWLTGCTVTDAESGKVLVRSRGDSALTGPSYVVIPGQMYEAEMKGTLNVYIARTRFEADKVTCYGTPYGLSCLRDPEVSRADR